MQRTAQQSGDLWEDSGGPGARSHQTDEFHVLPGKLHSPFSSDCSLQAVLGWSRKTTNTWSSLSSSCLPAHSDRPFLRWSASPVSHRAQERLCLRSLPAHPREVHQHVRSAGRTQEHEVQRQERPLRLQKVSWSLSYSLLYVFLQLNVITDTRWQHHSASMILCVL